MDKLHTSNRREQRKFGLQMAALFTVLGIVRWLLKGEPSPAVFTIAGIFLAVGIVAPMVLRPVIPVWVRLLEGLNWVVTRILLAITFYGLIAPGRVINQLFGSDPLKREWQPDAPSYWESPEDYPEASERYRDQF